MAEAKTVIGINGSPRIRNSAELLDHALKGAAEAGAAVECFNLGDLQFKGCKSCFACKLKGGKSFGKCAVQDDLTPILDKILHADALILSTPIYWGDVTGITRCFVERLLFPGLTYQKDGAVAYEKPVSTGLIVTMGMPEPTPVKPVIDSLTRAMGMILRCDVRVVTASATTQHRDYSIYVGDYNTEYTDRMRVEQFPVDCRNAFEMGKSLVS